MLEKILALLPFLRQKKQSGIDNTKKKEKKGGRLPSLPKEDR